MTLTVLLVVLAVLFAVGGSLPANHDIKLIR